MIRLVPISGLGQGSDEGGYPFRGMDTGVPQMQMLNPPIRTLSIAARAMQRPNDIAKDAGDMVLHSTGLSDPDLNQPAGDDPGESTLTTDGGAPATKRRWPWVVGGLGALAVVGIIIAVVVSRRKKGRR